MIDLFKVITRHRCSAKFGVHVTQSVTGTLVTPAIKFDIKVMTCVFSCHFSGVKQSISCACKPQGACQVKYNNSHSGETESDQININCF